MSDEVCNWCEKYQKPKQPFHYVFTVGYLDSCWICAGRMIYLQTNQEAKEILRNIILEYIPSPDIANLIVRWCY
jgi:hypothetical protein